MGNCRSSEYTERSHRRRRRRGDGATTNATYNTGYNDAANANERKWSGRHHLPHQRAVQSMARVGSRVFRQSTMEHDWHASGVARQQHPQQHPNQHHQQQTQRGQYEHDQQQQQRQRVVVKNTKPLKEHKASTYEHVHEIVNLGIDHHRHERAHRNNDTAQQTLSGKVGLANLGNTCFLSSSLQCLSHTIPLTDYFLGYDFRSEINAENALGTSGKLANSYSEVVKNLWLGGERSFGAVEFKRDLERFAPQFLGYEQHDSQELLAYLLDGIHEDLNRIKKRPYITDPDCDGTNDEGDAITAWSHYLQRNQSIIVDLFQGQLRNTLTCAHCSHVNVRFDPFMYLSLPIGDHCHSLDDCLELFCMEEVLEGDEAWYCPKCQDHVPATKKIDLFMLPPILIIHLKRFKFVGTHKSKIDKPINYTLQDWNLSSLKKSTGGIYPLYDLYAVSHHMGNVGFGHYVAHAKHRFDGEWYKFNDSNVTHIPNPGSASSTTSSSSSSSAYCLFYNRVEQFQQRNGQVLEKKTVIRRQSVGRPELWPHLQRNRASLWKSMRVPAQDMDQSWDDDDEEGEEMQLENYDEKKE